MASGNYASLAAVEITFRSIQPLFYSTPIRLGGLGLSTAKIGNVLAVSSVLNGLFQAIVFARMNERFGSKKTFMFGVASTIPCIVMFPLLNFIAQHKGHGNFLWAGLGLQILFSLGIGLGYGAIFIFIAKASPNRECIGATNGISQTSVSIMRAIGPAVASSLFSLSIEKGILGGHLVYYVLTTFVGIALYIASFLPHRLWDDME
ncbi:hypothetical protein D9613_008004 [Agrocybe pediades]|uniref:Major facilitator superfamily (MFS) profile domain-containing protein n=1 Tax=Agrocybe pediades TaxID=84607 RepID=A0A8H4QM86_9AGAR|nr:hypothetical protein D9613_008004 [Agrocybe pediades]